MPTTFEKIPEYTADSHDVTAAEKAYLDLSDTPQGLALSGGGVRSAAFALGVLQPLVRGDVIKNIDYMSTVSGGGYTGCALTWWLRRRLPSGTPAGTTSANFPFGQPDPKDCTPDQKSILNFLRFHYNYLSPTSTLTFLSIIAVLVRNFMVTLVFSILRIVPFILLALALITVVFLQAEQHSSILLDLFQETDPTVQLNRVLAALILISVGLCALLFLALSFGYAMMTYLLQFCQKLQARVTPLFKRDKTVYLVLFYFMESVSRLADLLRTKLRFPVPSPRINWSSFRYRGRSNAQKLFGILLTVFLTLLYCSTIPVVSNLIHQHAFDDVPLTAWTPTPSAETSGSKNDTTSAPPPNQGARLLGYHAIFFAACLSLGALLMLTPSGVRHRRLFTKLDIHRRTAGALLFLYGILFISFVIAETIFVDWTHSYQAIRSLSTGQTGSHNYSVVAVIYMLFFVAYLAGNRINVNYLGIHRVYRDRLMELFVPDPPTVDGQRWALAEGGNMARMEDMCTGENKKPYHLINTNVVLVDSKETKFRERGGANFLLSPLFCGSEATGWCRTDQYMKVSDPGITLPTAMAISGAVANPYSGASGGSWTRHRFISLVMAILSLRLGYWAPHPKKEIGEAWSQVPTLIFPGIFSTFLGGLLSEDNKMLDLTDGGHFENLGLYELLRRKLTLIVACDGSMDREFTFEGLALALERAKVDFGATIRFCDSGYGLGDVQGHTDDDARGQIPSGISARGFAVGKIDYAGGSTGTLIYIKPTLVKGVETEIRAYQMRSEAFPHEATVDQFFDELQFEAYRELGCALGTNSVPSIRAGRWEGENWVVGASDPVQDTS